MLLSTAGYTKPLLKRRKIFRSAPQMMIGSIFGRGFGALDIIAGWQLILPAGKAHGSRCVSLLNE
jgi:hypothetical protein